MFYLIYKITNTINNKIYIGCHKTQVIDDGYMGSGKYLQYAFQKYGLVNFTKEILFVFDNPKSMYEKEAEIVDEDFILENNTYNLKCGGSGGFDFINKNKLNNKVNQCSNGGKAVAAKGGGFTGKNHSETTKKNLSVSLKGRPPTFLGKNHSPLTKEKMKNSHTGKHIAEKNSQYGTMWIFNLELKENKKILKTDSIPEGWSKGRKIKF